MSDMESYQNLGSLRTPFAVIFTFLILSLPCYYLTKNAGWGPNSSEKRVIFDEVIVIIVKNASDRGVRLCIFKKLYKRDHPNV